MGEDHSKETRCFLRNKTVGCWCLICEMKGKKICVSSFWFPFHFLVVNSHTNRILLRATQMTCVILARPALHRKTFKFRVSRGINSLFMQMMSAFHLPALFFAAGGVLMESDAHPLSRVLVSTALLRFCTLQENKTNRMTTTYESLL